MKGFSRKVLSICWIIQFSFVSFFSIFDKTREDISYYNSVNYSVHYVFLWNMIIGYVTSVIKRSYFLFIQLSVVFYFSVKDLSPTAKQFAIMTSARTTLEPFYWSWANKAGKMFSSPGVRQSKSSHGNTDVTLRWNRIETRWRKKGEKALLDNKGRFLVRSKTFFISPVPHRSRPRTSFPPSSCFYIRDRSRNEEPIIRELWRT